MNVLVQGLDAGVNGGLRNGYTVKSGDFAKVWFIGAEITGDGIDPGEAVGIWATNDLGGNGLIYGIDGFAHSFSDWGDGTKTDAAMSMFDDGAQEAKACALRWDGLPKSHRDPAHCGYCRWAPLPDQPPRTQRRELLRHRPPGFLADLRPLHDLPGHGCLATPQRPLHGADLMSEQDVPHFVRPSFACSVASRHHASVAIRETL
jgi:hypothetical protein